ncbi:MAG: molybdopterin-synthase adenylyltransferase MoeB [Burkholderiales bacterium]|jgi:molybdopterin/thiamine biosynthesis adenylyltransferase|nr:molybdopterin-synthase adenylyltransferase MoeB [Burkholderiales bacterium]
MLDAMNDDDLLRYSRHILLDDIGVEGQERIAASHALVLGAGGLGSPVALYLASAGVGRITLVDDDVVDLTNLQRQIAHTEARVGQRKVDSAREAMLQINPRAQVDMVPRRADAALLGTLVAQATVAIDCSDNFATRHTLNAACVRHDVPLVSGAAIRFDGQVSVFDPRAHSDGERAPCYACLFPPEVQPEEVRCAVMGVFAPLVGIVGSLQATEALKLMASAGRSLAGRLLLIDALDMDIHTIRIARNPQCPVCGDAARLQSSTTTPLSAAEACDSRVTRR